MLSFDPKQAASIMDVLAVGDSDGREENHSNKDPQRSDDDAFACFGDDSSSSDENEAADHIIDQRTITIAIPSMARSLRLMKNSNKRMSAQQQQDIGPCIPLLSSTYEIFDSPGAGKGLKALKSLVCGEKIL